MQFRTRCCQGSLFARRCPQALPLRPLLLLPFFLLFSLLAGVAPVPSSEKQNGTFPGTSVQLPLSQPAPTPPSLPGSPSSGGLLAALRNASFTADNAVAPEEDRALLPDCVKSVKAASIAATTAVVTSGYLYRKKWQAIRTAKLEGQTGLSSPLACFATTPVTKGIYAHSPCRSSASSTHGTESTGTSDSAFDSSDSDGEDRDDEKETFYDAQDAMMSSVDTLRPAASSAASSFSSSRPPSNALPAMPTNRSAMTTSKHAAPADAVPIAGKASSASATTNTLVGALSAQQQTEHRRRNAASQKAFNDLYQSALIRWAQKKPYYPSSLPPNSAMTPAMTSAMTPAMASTESPLGGTGTATASTLSPITEGLRPKALQRRISDRPPSSAASPPPSTLTGHQQTQQRLQALSNARSERTQRTFDRRQAQVETALATLQLDRTLVFDDIAWCRAYAAALQHCVITPDCSLDEQERRKAKRAAIQRAGDILLEFKAVGKEVSVLRDSTIPS